MAQKRIIVSVISDLVTDQRVQRECRTLHELGYKVVLVGRKSRRNFQLNQLPFPAKRIPVPFTRGFLMYFCFNVELFFFILFSSSDILWSNDLDTLLPNFLISRVRSIPLIYDSHEYFTASVYKKFSRWVWERLEGFLFPRLANVLTVNQSIRSAYENKYQVPVTVLRNMPYRFERGLKSGGVALPSSKKILVIQGMGINEHRGAEEALAAMEYLPDYFQLYFIGGGTILDKLKGMTKKLHLEEKVVFIGPLPYTEMMGYTQQCFLGLIFEKVEVSEEHLFSLPNKFFDYIQAGIPVLSSRAIEIEKLIQKYVIGDFIDSFEPRRIAQKILSIEENSELYGIWKHNTELAARDFNWENEKGVLIDFMQHLR